jgi:hypothetical protein
VTGQRVLGHINTWMKGSNHFGLLMRSEVSTDVKIRIVIWIKTQWSLVDGSEHPASDSEYNTLKMEPLRSFESLLLTYKSARYYKLKPHNVDGNTVTFPSLLFDTCKL